MDSDDEVRLRVLEERVHGFGRSVREVEKCCGELKGDARRLGERVVVLEHDVNSNCVAIKRDVDGLVTGVAVDHEDLVNLRSDVVWLRKRLWWAITVALGALFIDLIGLLH